MSCRLSIPQWPASLLPGFAVVICVLVLAGPACAQEALRMSLAGDYAAASRREARNTTGYYNLLWGPVAWRFSSGLDFKYDDNVHLTRKAQGDFILRPSLNTQMHWPVTQKNSLDVSVGAGYSFYASHSELNQFYVTPGSGLSFDVYAGNCVINLHDRIFVTENAYQNPATGNNGNYARLENSAGVSALADLNKLKSQLGYDHINDVSLGSSQQAPDATTENWFLNAGLLPLPQVTVGVEGGFGLINYNQSQSPEPDATQWNAGAFCKAQISQYLTGRFDAGYTVYSPANSETFTNLSSTPSLYFQVSISHRVNRFLNYTLQAGRSTDSSFYGQPYDYYFVRLQPDWTFIRKCRLSTPFWWEKGTQLYALGGTADFNQFGAGINIRRALTQKLSGSLGYQFVRESSSQSSLNYTVNIVSLNFSYQF